MARSKRDWHPKFKEYMKFIVEHPNYKGMPSLYKENGDIRWIVAGNSEIGMARLKWWDAKRKEVGIKKETGWISKTARAIHPTGEKPCQICGKVMKLDYIYPNKKGGLSPGAMSNAPDRLDGFHTYNLCCRSKQDTGRHKENLSRYGEDRRAYENWSGGDWKAASWLMKVFQKHKISPDHLGPISLGFTHRPNFRPSTRAENSTRNNRMTYEDVLLLIEQERKEEVISAHSKYLWNSLKKKVKNDTDALKLSKIMRENMHYILSVFSYIAKKGHKNFLVNNFLHPEYANYSVKFDGFDPKTGFYKEMIKVEGNKKQYRNNAKRYIRIAFESLLKYSTKENRNLKKWQTDEVKNKLDKTINFLKSKDEKEALRELNEIFILIAENLVKKFGSEK